MPQDSPTLIDPNLLSQGIALDPMDALMAEVNRGLAATGNGSLHIENGSQDGRPEAELEDDGFSHSISSQLSIPSSQNLPVFTSLPDSFTVESNVHFGQQVKRGVDLSPQAENAFDIFCQAPTLQHHLILLYLRMLMVEDKIAVKAALWKMSKELEETAKTYAHCFLLSPTTTSYRGNVVECIVGAMRELNVPDLPLPHEISKLRVVETCIRNTLNAVRCSLKGQVEKSLEPGATTQNVAELTMAALGTSRIKATLQHYMRFAFLRWVSTSYPDASEQYWIKVDEKLLFARSKYQSATDLSAFFTAIYNNDVQKHGNPTSTHHTVVAPNKISEFQSVLNRHAGLVVPPPPEEESSKKRKRNKA